jgi:uracil-DNA glycosylase family 4
MNTTDRSDDSARRRLVQRLESLEQAGVTHLPKARARPAQTTQTVAASAKPAGNPAKAVAGSAPPVVERSLLTGAAQQQPAVPAAERPALLEVIRREVAGCTRCAELAATRTQTVFGVGNPSARLVFVGEAPGADEDRQGEPFVGRAGQLLTKIIEACRMRREDVYIANVLKCRPPDNRTPAPDEVTNCRGYLDRQLSIIRPEYICCLGAVATRCLLGLESPMNRIRGRFFEYEGIPVLCTYHPAYLLRNPAAKRDVWEDMKLLMKRLGVEL